jgi:hypothetical protein
MPMAISWLSSSSCGNDWVIATDFYYLGILDTTNAHVTMKTTRAIITAGRN